MDAKRKAEEESALVAVPKRVKQDIVPVQTGGSSGAIVAQGPPRTSNLKAPIMHLTGHQGDIFSSKFNPRGTVVASSSFDQKIFLWNVFGDCENFAVMSGHTGAVLDLAWSSDSTFEIDTRLTFDEHLRYFNRQVFSVGTDKVGMVWDAITGTRVRRLRGHSKFINAVGATRTGDAVLVTASDDATIKIWDTRRRNFVHSLSNESAGTAVCFNGDNQQFVSGGIDNIIKVWDFRKLDVVYTLEGHTDTITSLKLSPDGNNVLSNSMDATIRSWNIRPYSPSHRLEKIFQGAQHGFEKNLIKVAWTPDGRHVGAGSSDRMVYVWNYQTGHIVYRLPGHKGSVNEVDFHPSEPIILSGSSDKSLFLGELAL